jgi:hypothetical protein
LRLEALLHQISNAADGSSVVIHGDFNVDLDRVDDSAYYMATLAKTLAECTSTAGLETHTTSHTYQSYSNFTPAGDLSRPLGDVASPAGGGPCPAGSLPSPAGGGQSPAGDLTSTAGGNFHKYARLDHVYTKGLVSESKVMPDATTDHRPVVTTVRAGGHCPGTKLVSLKRRNFKVITPVELEGALASTDSTKVYAIKDVDDILDFITAGIVSVLDIIAPEKEIRVKKGQNLYLMRETLEAMRMRNSATGRRYRDLRNELSRHVRRDKQDSNLLSLKKASNDPKVLWHLADQELGVQTAPPLPPWRRQT